ncbi:O-succinylbenzoic acid--CoA ligase [Knoellia remsis]|uniref:O-succinylbenzoic acid--CoA ligase n=1 Tax=Knoellia remsis TaxID=407159 RepID=A0A2T0UN46_9MICO|nr:o-succinylbenzoate--CoA ligase [Knoellia remsis]PRY59340.1 O-succinylbenzoic acid--CoA ligase [Knoellia remsis]
MRIEPLAVPTGPAVLDLLPRLARALDGGRPIAPYAAGSPPPVLAPDWAREDSDTDGDLAVVIGTSGSTGTPKRAMLTSTNLRASIDATHARLDGPGTWLLTVPGHHIAGLQVLLRAITADSAPHVVDTSTGFTPRAFIDAVDTMPDQPSAPAYVSLVPTQLVRLLDDVDATERLARFAAVLVGGAATDPRLLERAAAADVTAVTTYGMSETAGGCVYSGRPLDGTRVDLDESTGRIHLTGPTVAAGYLADPERTAAAFPRPGTFRTDDVGHLDDDGVLHVDGRIDDVITTGGLKVAPRIVEEAVAALPQIGEAVAVGVPDPEWGQVVAVAVVPAADTTTAHPLTVSELREHLRGILPDHALPRALRHVTTIPTRGPGKPDRAGIRALFDAVGE